MIRGGPKDGVNCGVVWGSREFIYQFSWLLNKSNKCIPDVLRNSHETQNWWWHLFTVSLIKIIQEWWSHDQDLAKSLWTIWQKAPYLQEIWQSISLPWMFSIQPQWESSPCCSDLQLIKPCFEPAWNSLGNILVGSAPGTQGPGIHTGHKNPYQVGENSPRPSCRCWELLVVAGASWQRLEATGSTDICHIMSIFLRVNKFQWFTLIFAYPRKTPVDLPSGVLKRRG